MTEGEKMIWAAAYSSELSRRIKGVPDILDGRFLEWIKSQSSESAKFASVAVELATELDDGYSKEMLND